MPTIKIIGPFVSTSTVTNRMSRHIFTLIAITPSAKFWLDPVGLARNYGFNARELKKLQAIVIENRIEFLEAWNGYFGTGGG